MGLAWLAAGCGTSTIQTQGKTIAALQAERDELKAQVDEAGAVVAKMMVMLAALRTSLEACHSAENAVEASR